MKVYKTPSKEIQEIILANGTYEAVIEGLNGYFASEPRNNYITVKMESDGIKQDFALYETEAWADILISWLRTEHGIFYYPGMEAKHAKGEKIPPLTERLMDEGALNSLKKLHKRVTGKEPEVDSHTLIADGISHAVSVKETQIEELKTHIDLLRYDLWDSDTKDIMNYIRQEASRNGFELPEEIDNEPLTVKRVFHDLLEFLGMKETRIKTLNAELATAWTKASLINWLHQRARHKGVELDDTFLYSDDTQYDWTDIVDSLFDEIVKMRQEIKEVNDKRWKDLQSYHTPAAQRGKIRAEIENYKLKLKDYILKDIKEHGYRYDDLETKSIEEIVDWIITMATSDHSFIVLKDIYTAVAAPVERLRYNIDGCDGAIIDHMKDYILRRFEGLRINTEYCLRKMSELDGCQKDLKILEEQQEWLVKQISEYETKVSAKDDEISRLKDLINVMNEEVKDM